MLVPLMQAIIATLTRTLPESLDKNRKSVDHKNESKSPNVVEKKGVNHQNDDSSSNDKDW